MVRREVSALADLRALNIEGNQQNPLDGRRKLGRSQFPESTSDEPYPSDSEEVGRGGFHMVYLPASRSVSYNGKLPISMGGKRQTKKDREDEKLAAQVMHLKGKGKKITAEEIGKDEMKLHRKVHKAMEGGGATPSMGLSQFRGGAEALGERFGRLLMSPSGGSFFDAFKTGLTRSKQRGGRTGAYEGRGEDDELMPLTAEFMAKKPRVVREKTEAPSSEQRAVETLVKMREEKLKADKKSKKAKKGGMLKTGIITSAMTGKKSPAEALLEKLEGEMGVGHLQLMKKNAVASREHKKMTEGEKDAVAALTKMKRGGGKLSSRAALVKKVMQDRGISMIEASKLVKSEGMKY
jgi:hypothetical protein